MNAQWILSWWNLIFIVPFGLALLYLGVYTLSGWTFGDADADLGHDLDADADADLDADADADADADTDVDADADHDIGAEHDTDADSDHDADEASDGAGGPSAVWAALSFLGVGKVPLSILLMVMLLSWGGIGFITNQFARPAVKQPWQVATLSLPLAALGSIMATSGMSRFVKRYIPLNETFAKRRHELLGADGEALYAIDNRFGMVNVRDEHGDLFQLPCRVENGPLRIAKGDRVKLVAYSAKEGMYFVLPAKPQNKATSAATQN